MPFGSIKLIPGVNVERTPTLLEAGYASSSLIRWRDLLAEKLGGWIKFYPSTVPGIPRSLHAWNDLNSLSHLSVGTTTKWGVITSGSFQDITPQTLTSDFAPNFSTIMNTATVTIVDTNINTVTTFDDIYFNTPVAIGGLILSGLYPITLVTGATSYQITATSNATSTVNNAGAVPAFTTTSGSAFVSVALTAHGLSVGSTVNFPISTTVAGITIIGTYTVTAVADPNNFTIAGSVQASSNTTASMNSGNAELVYYINLGPPA